jgi:hypothetical protein
MFDMVSSRSMLAYSLAGRIERASRRFLYTWDNGCKLRSENPVGRLHLVERFTRIAATAPRKARTDCKAVA